MCSVNYNLAKLLFSQLQFDVYWPQHFIEFSFILVLYNYSSETLLDTAHCVAIGLSSTT